MTTTPTTTKSNTPANSPTPKSAAKPAPEKENVTKSGVDERIPAALADNSILADFFAQYLRIFDKIAAYNKDVLAERDSEWTAAKVMEKARELGNNDDASKVNASVKKVLDEFERLASELSKARKAVIETTSKELGITLSAVADRDPSVEAPLKEDRKMAIEIGSQLGMMAKMTTNKDAETAISEFLANNPLPAIGRDQVRTFGGDGKSTAKYRVNVVVSRDGATLLDESGFTKTALGLTKFYERGKAPKADTLREAWEKAGNSPEKTVTNPVEFDDNGLHFVITKKN